MQQQMQIQNSVNENGVKDAMFTLKEIYNESLKNSSARYDVLAVIFKLEDILETIQSGKIVYGDASW